MNITQEKTDDLSAIIKIELSPEDYKSKLNQTLRDYAQQANLRGFRKGKVPISLVKKMVGKSLLLDQLNELLSNNLQEYIQKEEMDVLGSPVPKEMNDLDLDPDGKTSYNFEYEVGLSPEVNVTYDVKNKPVLYKVNVDDSYLEKEIKNIAKRYGDMSNPETSQEGDILYGKLVAKEGQEDKIPSNPAFKGRPEVMVALNPDRMPETDFIKKMDGKSPEDVIENVKLDDLYKNDEAIRSVWQAYFNRREENYHMTKDDISKLKDLEYDFTVKRINRMEESELNEELFKQVFGEEEITSEDEFRERVKEDIKGFFDDDADKFLRSMIVKEMVKVNDLPLPDEFLKKWLLRSNEELTKEGVESEYDDYARTQKWALIVREVRKEHPDLLVDKDEVESHAKEMVKEKFLKGQDDVTEEQVEEFAKYYLSDQKAYEKFYQELLEDKVFDFMKEEVGYEEKEIDASEYIDLEV